MVTIATGMMTDTVAVTVPVTMPAAVAMTVAVAATRSCKQKLAWTELLNVWALHGAHLHGAVHFVSVGTSTFQTWS